MPPIYRQKIRILRLGENSYEFEDALVNRELTEKRFDSLSHFYKEVLDPYELKFKIPTILKNSHKKRHFTFACSCADCPFLIMLSTTKNFTNTEFNIHDATKEFSKTLQSPSQLQATSLYNNTARTSSTSLKGKSEGGPSSGFSSFSVIKPALSSNKIKKQEIQSKNKKDNGRSSSLSRSQNENIFEGEGIKVRLEDSLKRSDKKQQNGGIENDEDVTDTEDEEGRDITNLEQQNEEEEEEEEDPTKQYGPFAVTKILLEHNHSVNPNVNSIEGLKEFIMIKIPKVLHDDLKFDRLVIELFQATMAKDLAKQYDAGNNTATFIGKDTDLIGKSSNTAFYSSLNSEDSKFKLATFIQESGLLEILEKRYVLKPADVLADKVFFKSIKRKITTYKSRMFTRLKKEFIENREKMISEQLEAIQQEANREKSTKGSSNGSKKSQRKRKSSNALDEGSFYKRKQSKSSERKESNSTRVGNDEARLITDALGATASLDTENIDTSLTGTSTDNIDFVLKTTRGLADPAMVNSALLEQNSSSGIDKHRYETLNDKKEREALALLKSHTEAFSAMSKKKNSKSSSSKHSKRKKKRSSSKHNTADDAATAVAAVAAVEAVAMNSDLPLSDTHLGDHNNNNNNNNHLLHHHPLEDTEGMAEDLKNVVAHLDFMDSPLKYRSELDHRAGKNSGAMLQERDFDHRGQSKNEDIGDLVEDDDNIQPELKM
ncbi:hypothetical protein ACO0QE_002058 [Hanseniaspora vineae]